MLKDFKQLGKETAIYGISTIIGRFWNFLLVPLYTNIFSQAEYGLITNIYAVIALFNVVFLYGMDSAYMKYASSKELGDEKETFNTAFVALLISSLAMAGLFVLFKSMSLSLFELDEFQINIVYYVAGTLFFDSLCMIPFARLRLRNKALKFALIKSFNILLSIALNVYFIYVLKYSIEGVFLSGLIASFATFVLLMPEYLPSLKLKINKGLFRELLKFGLPFVPAGLASIMVQVINRPIMLKLTDAGTVGVFQANYKMGIFMMLIVSMFQYAWQPFFLNNAARPDAKLLFSKILTYFTLFTSFIFLTLSLFIENVIKVNIHGSYLIGKDFWGGIYIIPVILLGYLFNGMYVNFLAGIQISKQTKYLPFVSGIGAIITIVLNYILIPPFGMSGAAYAMLLSYVAMAYFMYKFSHKFYPVQYEWGKLSLIGVSLVIAGVVAMYGKYILPVNDIIIKLLSLTVFVVCLNIFRLIDLKYLKLILPRR